MASIKEAIPETEISVTFKGIVNDVALPIEKIRSNKFFSLSTLSKSLKEKNWAIWSK
jgi:hypothetical protein